MSCSCTVTRAFCPMHGDGDDEHDLADVPAPECAQQIRNGAVREHVSAASDTGREGPSVAASRNGDEPGVFALSAGGANARAHGAVPISIREWQAAAHAMSRSKGWYENPAECPSRDNVIATLARLALVGSEVSEAVECVRDGEIDLYVCDPVVGCLHGVTLVGGSKPVECPCGGAGKPEGAASELADVVIRVLDLAGALGIDLQDAIERKHAYNATRAHRHGGRAA